MKKNIYLILFVFSLLFSSCDTEGDYINHDYTKYQMIVMYPDPFGDFKNLSVTIDGENIKDGIFKGRNERIGIVEISYLDYVPFQQKVNLQPNETLQILLLPGKKIELYEEEKYITFNGSFLLNSGYIVKINGQELISGLNYISKEKAVGESRIL